MDFGCIYLIQGRLRSLLGEIVWRADYHVEKLDKNRREMGKPEVYETLELSA
jgi:hypothetical protein